MGIDGQAQKAFRAFFSGDGGDNLMIKITAGFLSVQRQPVADSDTLAAAGYPGVERALTILRDEIIRDMKLMGVTRVDQLGPDMLRWR